MTTFARRRLPVVPLLVLGGALAIAMGSRLVTGVPGTGTDAAAAGLAEPLLDVPPPAEAADGRDATAGPAGAAGATGGASAAEEELARTRADLDFWAARSAAHPEDIVAAVKLAETHLVEARLTGDVTAYLRAEAAADRALAAQAGYVPARSVRATILVSLHRFPEARGLSRSILATAPDDAVALGALGDASLELGDLTTAAAAYGRLGLVADGSASRVRAGRLAFVAGDPASAVAEDRAAVAAAAEEGLEGGALAFYHVVLGETQVATGDGAGARTAFEAALGARPDLPAALAGLSMLDAFDGDLDRAIARLDGAIAAIPLPEILARRADLLDLRGGPGDAAAAGADRATVEAIARFAGDAASVYDRGLSLYLSDHGLDPARAVRLAAGELAVRPDVYGHDALAWALVNAGRAADAETPMRAALAGGTRDARLWYHAGIVAAANGRTAEARRLLTDALALGPALDSIARMRAGETLDGLR